MASKKPTEAQRNALTAFSAVFGKQMRARAKFGSKDYEIYDVTTDDTLLTTRVPGPIFEALITAGWVEEVEPIHHARHWNISAAGRAARDAR